MDDWELLQAYVREQSEAAFAELVRRHLNWVYSTALRDLNDSGLAEDVAQSVFVLLAKKARGLRSGTLVGGWLFRTTRHVASHARRSEHRRRTREMTAMNGEGFLPQPDELPWGAIAPHLDEAVSKLPNDDRSAVLLRFYEKKSLREVAEKLGVTEEAAKKRVSRAVDKLRVYLEEHGAKLTAAALAALMSEHMVQNVSAALMEHVISGSMAAAGAGTATMPLLAREALRAWQLAKIKFVAAMATGSVLLLVTAIPLYRTIAGPHKVTSSIAERGQTADAVSASGAMAAPQTAIVGKPATPTKTGAITGLVIDAQGRPIAGAQVWSGFGQRPSARDVTDDTGHFGLNPNGAVYYVTVTADGFAADQRELEPDNMPGPLMFRLSPVPKLSVRIVDESGQGIPRVKLFLANWWGRAGTIAQYLETATDVGGRLTWLSPPRGELTFQFGQRGYRYSRTNRFEADGQEHVVVLHPAAFVTGQIVDSENGAGIPNFKLTSGYSQLWCPTCADPMWDSRSTPGSNGVYKFTIDEEQIPYLRIEADGYETVETQILLTNELQAVRDFALRPISETNCIRGVVLLPDGRPAQGIEVALCTVKAGVVLKGAAFDPEAFGNLTRAEKTAFRRITDEKGAFLFDPKPGAHTVVAVCDAGIGQVRCFERSTPFTLQLKAWGRIEGVVRTRDGRWSGRVVKRVGNGILTDWMTVFYDANAWMTRSDEAGRFVLDKVPPGTARVFLRDTPDESAVISRPVEVKPGETVTVQVGGDGRPVVGKLTAAAGLEIRNWSNQVTFAQLKSKWNPYALPPELKGYAAEKWKLEFEDMEAGREWFRAQYDYMLKIAPDGLFMIPEVLPGNYIFFVNVTEGQLGSGPSTRASHSDGPQIASRSLKVEVKAGSDLIDLGAIEVQPSPRRR